MLKPIKIGSLCVCDSDMPYGILAYETWQDRGIWRLHTDYDPKVPRAKKLLINVMSLLLFLIFSGISN